MIANTGTTQGRDSRFSTKSWTSGKGPSSSRCALKARPCQHRCPHRGIWELQTPPHPPWIQFLGCSLGFPWTFPGARDLLSLGFFTLNGVDQETALSPCAGRKPSSPISWPCSCLSKRPRLCSPSQLGSSCVTGWWGGAPPFHKPGSILFLWKLVSPCPPLSSTPVGQGHKITSQ